MKKISNWAIIALLAFSSCAKEFTYDPTEEIKDNAENGGLFGAFGAFGNRAGSSGSGYGGGASYGGRGRHEIPAPEMDSSERRMYVLGMLKASLGIGMIYVLAFAVLLGVLVAIW